jgi:hypothetical protein
MPFSHQLTARRVRLAKYSPMGGCAEGLLCCRHLLAVKAGGPDGVHIASGPPQSPFFVLTGLEVSDPYFFYS